MPRMSVVVGFGVMLMAISGCGRSGPAPFAAKIERHHGVTLFRDPANKDACAYFVADQTHAFDGETIVFQIHNACTEDKTVSFKWTTTKTPPGPTPDPVTVISGKTAPMKLPLYDGAKADSYPYDFDYPGKPSLADPDIVVDPR